MDSKEALLLIVPLVAGGLIGWLIAHVYYKMNTRDQERLFGKISKEIRDEILANPDGKITRDDLMLLLEKMSTAPVDASRLQGAIDCGTY